MGAGFLFQPTTFFVEKGVVQKKNERWTNVMDRSEKWNNDRFLKTIAKKTNFPQDLKNYRFLLKEGTKFLKKQYY